MWIHSSFYLFHAEQNAAVVMFKGQQLHIKSDLIDSRFEKFVQFYKVNPLSADFKDTTTYNAVEIDKLKNLIFRNQFATSKQKSHDDEDFLSYLKEENSFKFKQIKNGIRWYSTFNKSTNDKIASTLKFDRIFDLNQLSNHDFCILFADPYNQKDLSALASLLQKSNCHWLLVLFDYFNLFLGPIRTIHSSFCLQCLILRFASNQTNPQLFKKMDSSVFSQEYEIPSFYVNITNGYIMSEILKFYTDGSSQLTHSIFEIGLIKPHFESSRVLPFPNCSVCEENHEFRK